MDENLQNIENLFRDGLEDNEEMPSKKVWDGIDNVLDKDNVINIRKKYSNLKKVAIILFILLSGLSIYELNNRHTIHNSIENKWGEYQVTNKNLKREVAVEAAKNEQSEKNDTMSRAKKGKIINKPSEYNILSEKESRIIKQRIVLSANIYPTDTRLMSDLKIKVSKEKKYPPSIIDYNPVTENNHLIRNKKNIVNKNRRSNINVKNGTTEIVAQDEINWDEAAAADVRLPKNMAQLNPAAVETMFVSNPCLLPPNKIKQSSEIKTVVFPFESDNRVYRMPVKQYNNLSKFSLTPFFSSDIARYRLQEDKPDNQQDDINEIEQNENHEFSSTTGILVDYNLKRHWGLQTGLTYSSINIIVDPKIIYAQPDNTGNIKYRLNTSSGYGFVLPSFSNNPTLGDSLYAFTSTNNLHYIGIPMALKYIVYKGKFSFNAMTGFSANILLSGKIQTTLEMGLDKETEMVNRLEGLKHIYCSGLAGLGVGYNINKQFALNFAPTYRFALNAINKNVPVKSFPNSFGLALGVKIKL